MAGLKIVFIIAVATTGLSLLICLCNKWKRLDPEVLANGGPAVQGKAGRKSSTRLKISIAKDVWKVSSMLSILGGVFLSRREIG